MGLQQDSKLKESLAYSGRSPVQNKTSKKAEQQQKTDYKTKTHKQINKLQTEKIFSINICLTEDWYLADSSVLKFLTVRAQTIHIQMANKHIKRCLITTLSIKNAY